jgi:phage regulator Rha-like protein
MRSEKLESRFVDRWNEMEVKLKDEGALAAPV